MTTRARIVSKGGWARALVPLYSADQALFTAAVLLLIFTLLHALKPGDAGLLTLSGAVGASVVAYSARPAYLLVESDRPGAIVEILQSIGYRYIDKRDHWVPPIPRWQRWTYNFVTIEQEGPSIRVYGPINLLHFLRDKAYTSGMGGERTLAGG